MLYQRYAVITKVHIITINKECWGAIAATCNEFVGIGAQLIFYLSLLNTV